MYTALHVRHNYAAEYGVTCLACTPCMNLGVWVIRYQNQCGRVCLACTPRMKFGVWMVTGKVCELVWESLPGMHTTHELGGVDACVLALASAAGTEPPVNTSAAPCCLPHTLTNLSHHTQHGSDMTISPFDQSFSSISTATNKPFSSYSTAIAGTKTSHVEVYKLYIFHQEYTTYSTLKHGR